MKIKNPPFIKTRQGSVYTYFNFFGAANLFFSGRKTDMSYKRPNSVVMIKMFFSAWTQRENYILYKHLYGYAKIVIVF